MNTLREEIKTMAVEVGDTIKIIDMIGEPQYCGKTGTVTFIDDAGQIHGTWGGCAVIPETDIFLKIS